MFISKKKVKQIENDLDVLCQRIDYIEDWAYLIFDHLGVKVEAKEELAEDGTVARFSDWKLTKKIGGLMGRRALKTPKDTPKKEELSWWRMNLEAHNKHMDEVIDYLKHSKDLVEAIVQDNERLSDAIAPSKQRDWGEFLPDESHPKLKKIWSKTWHIALSFLLGVAITTVVHIILTNHQVRKTAEAVCTVFGADERQCKDGIDNVLDMADQVTENNTNVKGE